MLSQRVKQLEYFLLPRPWKLEKPVVIQFPVIDICNSQCQMCRIWENKKSQDITVEQLRKGLRNPLYSKVRGVGINGGEPTLRKDLGPLTRVLWEELPSLQHVSLITNAYKYREVIARITDIGSVAKEFGGKLDVMVSLDGFGAMHDLVRGKPGNFERARKVIEFARSSELVDNLRIGCTIIKANAFGLHDLLDFCMENELYIKYRLGLPHKRLYTENLLDPYALNEAERYNVVEFLEGLICHYEQNEFQRFFYRSLIDQIVHNAPRRAGCDWQHRGATITSKGELLYCAVQSKVLGKIQEDDSAAAYFGNAPHLEDIISTKCDTCVHDYTGVPPREEMLRRARARAVKQIKKLPFGGAQALVSAAREFRSQRAFSRRQRHWDQLVASGAARAATPVAVSPATGSPRVMICGWYGTETLGDKAILGGLVRLLKSDLRDPSISVVSLNPYVSHITRSQMPELEGSHVLTVGEALERIGEFDLLLFGGGPIMAIGEIAEMKALFEAARHRNIPRILAGCGVGPLGIPGINEAIAGLLKAASIRIYRDERSRALAVELGVAVDEATDWVAEDPAFSWLRQNRSAVLPEGGGPSLVLGLRDFPAAQYAAHLGSHERERASGRFEAAVLEALDALMARHDNLSVRPLPMCTNHFGDDDRWYYRRLFKPGSPNWKRLDRSLLGQELPPLEYLRAIEASSAVLTMRFHSLVFAIGAGRPAVAIDYTLGKGKVAALAERFGVPFRSLLDLNAEFLFEQFERILGKPTPALPEVEILLPGMFEKALGRLVPGG